jgi:hypothetical protein
MPQILETVELKDLWIDYRKFCTIDLVAVHSCVHFFTDDKPGLNLMMP